MINEEKKELFIALCGYYPHGVMVKIEGYGTSRLKGIDNGTVSTERGINYPLRLVKPYLRTMDSMTEEEQIKFSSLCELTTDSNGEKVWSVSVKGYDWLNANFFDYRNFIPKRECMPMQSITPGNRRRVKVSVWDGMSNDGILK